MSKNILITGGCGFVGSALALAFKAKYPAYTITALDNLKRRGSELNIRRLQEAEVQFIHGDIRNKEDLETIKQVDVLIEAAAEPSVMAGLDSSTAYLVHTNLNGTINCLDLALKHKADFIFLSTSRVYPIHYLENVNFFEAQTRFELSEQQTTQGFSQKGVAENFPMDRARSLYGSTKYASELLIQEYNEMLGLRTVVNRCGVLTGAYQMGKIDQGVVVLWMARHFWKQKLGYFGYGGEGKQVRDMLHTADLFDLIDYQLHQIEAVNGQTFNVGGGRQISASLQEMTVICEEITGNKIEIAKQIENRAADIRIYLTDNQKVTAKTNWKPQKEVKEIFTEIYEWIRRDEQQLKGILG
jgi:CDP-paratose 2-epimerase